MIQGTMIVISHTCRGIYKNIAQLLVTVKHVSITLLTKLTLQIPLKEKIVGEGLSVRGTKWS